jgi:hypothetical protein
MTLVDTSVWIDLLNGPLGSRVTEAGLLVFVKCILLVSRAVKSQVRAPGPGTCRSSRPSSES